MRVSLATLALAACSGDINSPSATGADAPSEEATRDSTPTDSGAADTEPPAWLRVEATLAIAAGTPDPLASALALVGLDVEELEVCALNTPLAFAVVDPAPPGLLAWWDVSLTNDPSCPLPNPVRLGIGSYDPVLDPAAAAAGLGGTLYGLYTASPAAELWIFGVAGTPENFDGVTAPVTVPPLPDGSWRLESLVLLPL